MKKKKAASTLDELMDGTQPVAAKPAEGKAEEFMMNISLTQAEIDATVMLKAWANFFLRLDVLSKDEREEFLRSVKLIHTVQWKIIK